MNRGAPASILRPVLGPMLDGWRLASRVRNRIPLERGHARSEGFSDRAGALSSSDLLHPLHRGLLALLLDVVGLEDGKSVP